MTEFEEIYKEYFQDVYLFIRALSKDESIAEEITSLTFFKAITALDSFQGKCDIRVWLCQIAKNSYISYLRRSKGNDQEAISDNLDDDFSLEQSIVDTETSYTIHQILHQLPEPYREVFSLRVLGSLSFKQIAELFNKTDNWACVTFHRAKNKIKEQLEDNK